MSSLQAPPKLSRCILKPALLLERTGRDQRRGRPLQTSRWTVKSAEGHPQTRLSAPALQILKYLIESFTGSSHLNSANGPRTTLQSQGCVLEAASWKVGSRQNPYSKHWGRDEELWIAQVQLQVNGRHIFMTTN